MEKGCFVGVGMAGMLFLPDGGKCIMERRDVTVVESQMPLCGDLAAPVDAVPQKPPLPQWPLKLDDSVAMPEPEALNEAVPSLELQQGGSSPASAFQQTTDPTSLQLDDVPHVGNADHETAESPNIHEQVPGATMQQKVEVAGLEAAADTSPAAQLRMGSMRSTRVPNAVQCLDPTPQTGSQQGVSQQAGNANDFSHLAAAGAS
jgi:hypothetical protein